MATDGPTPPPCNPDIYKNGQPVLAIEGSSNAIENWVRELAKKANAQIDWHYSGGVAQVLHLGNEDSWNRVQNAITELRQSLNGHILKEYKSSEKGLHRNDVDDAPKDTKAGFYVDGKTQFIG